MFYWDLFALGGDPEAPIKARPSTKTVGFADRPVRRAERRLTDDALANTIILALKTLFGKKPDAVR